MARTLAGTVKEILGSAQVYMVTVSRYLCTCVLNCYLDYRVLAVLLMGKIHMISLMV